VHGNVINKGSSSVYPPCGYQEVSAVKSDRWIRVW